MEDGKTASDRVPIADEPDDDDGRAQRLAGLGRLAAGLCHEINNPLGFIVTSTELIAQELAVLGDTIPEDAHAELQHLVDAIATGASRIGQLVRNVKVFARHSETAAELVALEEAVDGALDMLRHRANDEVDLRIAIPPRLLVVGRRLELEQVIVNLVENALQAMELQTNPAPRVDVVARRDEGMVSIEVSDNGPGIDASDLDRVFEPFFTTKAVGKGTGIGLSICHSLIAGMAGSIAVRNEVGGGATFTVRLPAAPYVEPGVPQQFSDEVTGPLGDFDRPARVLVVDDEPLVLSTLRRALRPHSVSTASCVQDALALCSEVSFEVILCDVMMPGLDGCDFHRLLAQLRPGTESRVVFITGGGSVDGVQRFLDRIPNRHLHKPFDTRVLRAFIADELQRHRSVGVSSLSAG